MFDFILDILGGYGGGISALGLTALAGRMEMIRMSTAKLILEGSENIIIPFMEAEF